MDRSAELNLLKTARGQIDGIIKMLENDRYCIDVSKQILAVQALLKKTNLEILKNHSYFPCKTVLNPSQTCSFCPLSRLIPHCFSTFS